MPLFEIAIVEKVPKKKGKDEKESLIFGPSPMIAKDEKAAATKVLLDNAEKLKKSDTDNLIVLVRPFA